jgi:hypothetical protein
MDDFLQKHPDTSFVRHFQPLVSGDWKNPQFRLICQTIDNPFFEKILRAPFIGRRLRKRCGGECGIPSRPRKGPIPPTNAVWYGGDNWVVLSRKAATHLTTSPVAAEITDQLKGIALPEESIFQTALLNASENERGVILNQHLRSINWHPGIGSPKIFRTEDFDHLQKSSEDGRLLARKFDLSTDAEILSMIRKRLISKNN